MNTYTDRLIQRMPAAGDIGWDDEMHDNVKINDFVAAGVLGKNKVISGGVVSAGTGLNADYTAMVVRVGGQTFSISASSVSVTASSLNFVYVDDTGAVTTALSVPTGDFVPLGLVDAGAAAVDRVGDARPMYLKKGPAPPSGVEIRGGVAGLEAKPNATTPIYLIDIAPGACMDSSGIQHMVLASSMTKDVSGSWFAGNNQGILLNGTVAASKLYHVYLITKADGTADIGAVVHGDDIATYLPSGYVNYRWITCYLTDTSSLLRPFVQNDKRITFDTGFPFATGLTHTSFTSTDLSMVAPAGHAARVRLASYYTSTLDTVKCNLSGSAGELNLVLNFINSLNWDQGKWVDVLPDASIYTACTNGYGSNLWVKAIEIIR